MFGFGPIYLFVLRNRFPNGLASARDWLSTMATNVAIAVLVTLMVMWLGWKHFLAIHGPITLIAASIGVWLFYVQHQFEDTLWVRKSDWRHDAAALQGSSNYLLPQPLAWFTANIGLHHVHHLSSRIPFYRLPDVLRRWRELDQATSLTLVESLRCVTLALWDEESHKLVPFRAINTVSDGDIAGQKDHEPVRHRVNRRGRSRVPPRALPRRRGGTGSDKRTMGWVNDLVDGSRDREDRGEKIIAAGPIPPIAAGPLPPKDGEDI